MTINDIWGQINVEPCYEKIINSKEFVSQKIRFNLDLIVTIMLFTHVTNTL